MILLIGSTIDQFKWRKNSSTTESEIGQKRNFSSEVKGSIQIQLMDDAVKVKNGVWNQRNQSEHLNWMTRNLSNCFLLF